MPKPNCIELPTGETIPILYEDRSVLAIDKPRGWMLVPFSWQQTSRNLQAALMSSIAARDFWARSRNLKFLRFVHRLDADTSGVMLFARSQGALDAYGSLFESRKMEKIYLAVVHGTPQQSEWVCQLKLGPDPHQRGRMKVDPRQGKSAETSFRVIQTIGRNRISNLARPRPNPLPQEREPRCEASTKRGKPSPPPNAGTPSPSPRGEGRGEGGRMPQTSPLHSAARSRQPEEAPFVKSAIQQSPPGPAPTFTLLEARPFTGRTHQIRVHLAESGCPIVGDELYAAQYPDQGLNLGLRAVSLAYHDPFTRRRTHIEAAAEAFCREYGFAVPDARSEPVGKG